MMGEDTREVVVAELLTAIAMELTRLDEPSAGAAFEAAHALGNVPSGPLAEALQTAADELRAGGPGGRRLAASLDRLRDRVDGVADPLPFIVAWAMGEARGADRRAAPHPFTPLDRVADARCGVVAVASGPGIVEAFRQAGVQGIVVPANDEPTTGELLTAIDDAAASTVVVLPNARNLVPIAEQLDTLSTKRVLVVPTRSVPQGLAAMAAYEPAAEVDELLDDMAAAASSVLDGEVVRAMRPAFVPFGRIDAGDWLGVADGTVVVADSDLESALRGLVAAILPPVAEAVSLFLGAGAPRSAARSLEAWLGELRPGLTVTVVDGRQPTPFLVSIA
jgi:hypothetical protein